MAKDKEKKGPTFEERQKALEEQMKAVASSPQFIWNMNHNLQYFMIHAFKGLLKHKHSHPSYMEYEEWQTALKHQLKMWKWLHKHHYEDQFQHDTKIIRKRVNYEAQTNNFLYAYGGHLWD